jgi:hypothetical protein
MPSIDISKGVEVAKTIPNEIVEYWSTRESEEGLSVDWANALDRCWRCAEQASTSQGSKRLELCHIVPDALGGKDEPHNFVILCWRCHLEAPNVADPSYMWTWLRAHAEPLYDTYWTARAIEEFEKLFNRKPGSILIDYAVQNGLREKDASRRWDTALDESLRQAIRHWGQGRMNPATSACVIHTAEIAALEKWKDERSKSD